MTLNFTAEEMEALKQLVGERVEANRKLAAEAAAIKAQAEAKMRAQKEAVERTVKDAEFYRWQNERQQAARVEAEERARRVSNLGR